MLIPVHSQLAGLNQTARLLLLLLLLLAISRRCCLAPAAAALSYGLATTSPLRRLRVGILR